MPENWKTYKLGEVAEVQNGFAFKSKDMGETGIPVIKIKNIVSPNVTLEGAGYYSGEIDAKLEKYILRRDDFLISMTGSTVNVMSSAVGKMGKYRLDDIALLNQRVGKIYITNTEKADFDYVCHFLNRYDINYNLALNATGSANQANISPAQIKDIKILLPPLHEQKSIASILSALDDKIELNLQMNKTLEEMAMALYKHWFVDFGPFQDGEFVDSELGEIPKGWEVKTLEDIIKFSNGYAFKSKQLLKEEEPDSFHIFKMGHIKKGGGLKADGTKSWIKRSDCNGLNKYILRTGDILMSMTDMKDNMTILGHTALMNENEKFIVNQRVGLLRVANKYGIDYPFVFLLTNSTDFIQRLRSQANSGVQVNLSTNAIKSAKVVVPNKEVNIEFNNITLPYYESINQNALENQTLTKLRDTLLPKLISGEVRVKEVEKIVTEAL